MDFAGSTTPQSAKSCVPASAVAAASTQARNRRNPEIVDIRQRAHRAVVGAHDNRAEHEADQEPAEGQDKRRTEPTMTSRNTCIFLRSVSRAGGTLIGGARFLSAGDEA